MSSTATTLDRAHPIVIAAAQIQGHLEDVRDLRPWSMSPAETRDTMVAITRVQAQLAELEARVAAHGQAIEVENGTLLCPRHHARAHDPTYEIKLPEGKIRFHRRT